VREAAVLARELRRELHAEHAYRPRSAGKGLRDADRARARYAALRGERERERAVWTLKHLASGEQREVHPDRLARAAREE
jgi:histidyl-tRNA synthetase